MPQGTALGNRAKEIRKADSFRAQLVNIGRSGVQATFRTSKARPTDIVGKDDHKVRLFGTYGRDKENRYEK
jgi:hypothetical protein